MTIHAVAVNSIIRLMIGVTSPVLVAFVFIVASISMTRQWEIFDPGKVRAGTGHLSACACGFR